MIKLYGVPTCTQIRKTKALFDQHGIPFEFINVKKDPVSEEKLDKIIAQAGLDLVLNKKGTTYRKLGLGKMNLNERELIEWLLKEQSMIKRPLIEKEGRFMIGYDEQAILSFVKNK